MDKIDKLPAEQVQQQLAALGLDLGSAAGILAALKARACKVAFHSCSYANGVQHADLEAAAGIKARVCSAASCSSIVHLGFGRESAAGVLAARRMPAMPPYATNCTLGC